jgi:hypothetical protein
MYNFFFRYLDIHSAVWELNVFVTLSRFLFVLYLSLSHEALPFAWKTMKDFFGVGFNLLQCKTHLLTRARYALP